MVLKDLVVESPYSVYVCDGDLEYLTFDDFYEDYGANIGKSLPYRFDIYPPDDEDSTYAMALGIIEQDVSLLTPVYIKKVRDSDVPKILEYLEKSRVQLYKIWEPIINLHLQQLVLNSTEALPLSLTVAQVVSGEHKELDSDYPLDHYRYGITPEEEVTVERVEVIYTQDTDCVRDGDDVSQSLKFFTDNGGGGPYAVMETKRWTIDSLDDLVKLYSDFAKRAGVE